MTFQAGVICPWGLVYFVKVSPGEFDKIKSMDTSAPTVVLDKETGEVVIIFGQFLWIPLRFLPEKYLKSDETEVAFCIQQEDEFFCKKVVTFKLTRELLLKAQAIQEFIGNLPQKDVEKV